MAMSNSYGGGGGATDEFHRHLHYDTPAGCLLTTDEGNPTEILAIGALVDTLVSGGNCVSAFSKCQGIAMRQESKQRFDDYDSAQQALAQKALSWDDSTLETMPASLSDDGNAQKRQEKDPVFELDSNSVLEGPTEWETFGCNGENMIFCVDGAGGGATASRFACGAGGMSGRDVSTLAAANTTRKKPDEIVVRTRQNLKRPEAKSRKSLARLGEDEPTPEMTWTPAWWPAFTETGEVIKENLDDLYSSPVLAETASLDLSHASATVKIQNTETTDPANGNAPSEGAVVTVDPANGNAPSEGGVVAPVGWAKWEELSAIESEEEDSAASGSKSGNRKGLPQQEQPKQLQPLPKSPTMEENPVEYQELDYRRRKFADSKYVPPEITAGSEDSGFGDIEDDESTSNPSAIPTVSATQGGEFEATGNGSNKEVTLVDSTSSSSMADATKQLDEDLELTAAVSINSKSFVDGEEVASTVLSRKTQAKETVVGNTHSSAQVPLKSEVVIPTREPPASGPNQPSPRTRTRQKNVLAACRAPSLPTEVDNTPPCPENAVATTETTSSSPPRVSPPQDDEQEEEEETGIEIDIADFQRRYYAPAPIYNVQVDNVGIADSSPRSMIDPPAETDIQWNPADDPSLTTTQINDEEFEYGIEVDVQAFLETAGIKQENHCFGLTGEDNDKSDLTASLSDDEENEETLLPDADEVETPSQKKKHRKIPFVRGIKKRFQRFKARRLLSSNPSIQNNPQEVMPMTGVFAVPTTTGDVSAQLISKDESAAATKGGMKVAATNGSISCARSFSTGLATVPASNLTKDLLQSTAEF